MIILVCCCSPCGDTYTKLNKLNCLDRCGVVDRKSMHMLINHFFYKTLEMLQLMLFFYLENQNLT